MQKIILVILTTILLSSCASLYTSNAEKKYLNTQNGPKLVVPSPLTTANISDFYNLPPQEQDPRVSVEPPPL